MFSYIFTQMSTYLLLLLWLRTWYWSILYFQRIIQKPIINVSFFKCEDFELHCIKNKTLLKLKSKRISEGGLSGQQVPKGVHGIVWDRYKYKKSPGVLSFKVSMGNVD